MPAGIPIVVTETAGCGGGTTDAAGAGGAATGVTVGDATGGGATGAGTGAAAGWFVSVADCALSLKLQSALIAKTARNMFIFFI